VATRESYVILEAYLVDSMAYCERQELLPSFLAGQIDLFCALQRPLRPVGTPGDGLWVGSLDAPRGGAEHLIIIADDYFLICVAILQCGTDEPDDGLERRLQEDSYLERINLAYGKLIQLRNYTLP
jgi:hypothetical protein